jgi:hypothetical protein
MNNDRTIGFDLGAHARREGLGYGRQASRLSGQTAAPAVRQARGPSAGQAGRLSSRRLRGDSQISYDSDQ